jgi:hypothetical protein
MKSLKRRFQKISKENPYWSTNTCFNIAIRGQNFNEQTIRRFFNKLVDKDDYDKKDKKELLAFHLESAKEPEDNRKRAEKASCIAYNDRYYNPEWE